MYDVIIAGGHSTGGEWCGHFVGYDRQFTVHWYRHAAEAARHATGASGHAAGASMHATGASGHAAGAFMHATEASGHAAGASMHATEGARHAVGIAGHATSVYRWCRPWKPFHRTPFPSPPPTDDIPKVAGGGGGGGEGANTMTKYGSEH
jgi:hypothetical protein